MKTRSQLLWNLSASSLSNGSCSTSSPGGRSRTYYVLRGTGASLHNANWRRAQRGSSIFGGNSEPGITIAPGNGNIGRVFGSEPNGAINGLLLNAVSLIRTDGSAAIISHDPDHELVILSYCYMDSFSCLV